MKADCWLSFTSSGAIISASSARGAQAAVKEKIMKKRATKTSAKAELAEYDFSRGVRGKYARRYQNGANVVVLEPDVAKVFSTSESVNKSLRALAGIIRSQKISAGK